MDSRPADGRTDGRMDGWTDGWTDGRTDMLKSTQKVILSRTVYIKVGVGCCFDALHTSAQTQYTLST